MTDRPLASEHDPFYSTYVDLVPDGDVVSILAAGAGETSALLATCGEAQEVYRYSPGKWSLREVVGHLADAERLYAYRALHFARADPSPLPGMDRNLWAGSSNAAERPLRLLAAELAAVRAATVGLFSSFDAAAWAATGVAGGRTFSVRAIAYVIAGHEIHHRGVLRARYLGAA